MRYIIETLPTSFSVRRNKKPLVPVPHIHDDLEMIYNIRGSTVAVLDNTEYYVNPGDVFLAFPNRIHGYRDLDDREGFVIIFSNDLYKALFGTFMEKMPQNPVVPKENLPGDFLDQLEQIWELCSSGQELWAQGLYLTLLAQILAGMDLIPVSGSPDTIKTILAYCFSHYQEPINLDSAARTLHLNRFYISHIFKERMGMGFSSFINMLRVEHACGLLDKEKNITEIAFASGFSSTRTFNRVFREIKGMPPREYKNKGNL